MRLLPVAVAAAFLAPALVGCGGSSDPQAAPASPATSSSPTTGPSPSPSSGPSSRPAALTTLNGDGFTIGLPGKAESTTQTVPTKAGKLKITLYTATDADGGTFVVAMNEYPSGVALDLDGAVNGAASNVQGTVKENRTVTFQGNPARQARYTASPQGQPVTIFARLVQKGQKLFQVQYFLPQEDLAAPPAVFGQVLDTVTFD